MVHISQKRLISLLNALNGKTIAVVGDLMLDSYIWGKVNRISPEAPVPVVDVETEQVRLGGAANVAHNIKSLGGKPLLVGVVGDDSSGKKLLNIIHQNTFPADGIVVDPARPTTVKTRIIAHSQHVVRIDRESREEISTPIQNGILETLLRNSEAIDGIIIEDYNKGVVVKDLIHEIIKWANQHKKPITVDPKYNNFFEFTDVTVFKPNRKEVEEVLGLRMNDDHDVITAGKKILERLNASSVLLTRASRECRCSKKTARSLTCRQRRAMLPTFPEPATRSLPPSQWRWWAGRPSEKPQLSRTSPAALCAALSA